MSKINSLSKNYVRLITSMGLSFYAVLILFFIYEGMHLGSASKLSVSHISIFEVVLVVILIGLCAGLILAASNHRKSNPQIQVAAKPRSNFDLAIWHIIRIVLVLTMSVAILATAD